MLQRDSGWFRGLVGHACRFWYASMAIEMTLTACCRMDIWSISARLCESKIKICWLFQRSRCDPRSRNRSYQEYVPLLLYSPNIILVNLGVRKFADMGATVCELMDVLPHYPVKVSRKHFLRREFLCEILDLILKKWWREPFCRRNKFIIQEYIRKYPWLPDVCPLWQFFPGVK